MKQINAPEAPQAGGSYAQAVQVDGFSRILFVSGQIPVTVDGAVPSEFEDQARLVWGNIGSQLNAAGMSFGNIAKITTFLGDRRYREENARIRQDVLGSHAPALTVIVCDIYDEQWLLEIEVVAVS